MLFKKKVCATMKISLWRSGRVGLRRHPAKVLYGVICTESSNLSFSGFKPYIQRMEGFLNAKSPQIAGFCRIKIKKRIFIFTMLSNFYLFFQKFSGRCFHRTYISAEEEAANSKDQIKWAINLAKKKSITTDKLIFDFIEKVLLLELEDDINSDRYQNILNFTFKFQQYTSPLMAKGIEDTFFYRYNRLISLNEVGGDPNKFGLSIEEFHQHNLKRKQIIPNSLLSSSTHDTKRSEDARCRINVISEFPEEWEILVKKLHSISKTSQKKQVDSTVIDKNDEYLIYQSLIGICGMEELKNDNRQNLETRLENYILKAVKEAKVHTSWLNVNSDYEQAVSSFIKRIFNYSLEHPFWKTFLPFENLITNIGYINSISQNVLKLTCPGVPDIYQGSEIFKFTVVDPDNRKPVDYIKMNKLFETIQPLINYNPEIDDFELFKQNLLHLEPNAIKLFYTTAILNLRNQNSDLLNSASTFL